MTPLASWRHCFTHKDKVEKCVIIIFCIIITLSPVINNIFEMTIVITYSCWNYHWTPPNQPAIPHRKPFGQMENGALNTTKFSLYDGDDDGDRGDDSSMSQSVCPTLH